MYPICAGQIKAARAILDWSQDDLAQATGLSITTIRTLEAGHISPRGTTNNVVRQAIENAGLEFIDPEGVRRRADEVRIYEGIDSREFFFNDMLHTVREKGGEVLCSVRSLDTLVQSFSLTNSGKLGCLEQLNELAVVKCLLSEADGVLLHLSSFQLRTTPRENISPLPYYVYGDKHALVLCESGITFKFVVFKSVLLAQKYRDHFLPLWNDASPLPVQIKNQQRRISA